MSKSSYEIAATAARLVVEEGMDYGPAKRRAASQLGCSEGLPGNRELEQAVRKHIEIFCTESQPQELLALRLLALAWMERLAEFRPHLSGAVWQGTATRLSDVHLLLFCDDSKMLEIFLLDSGIRFHVQPVGPSRVMAVDCLTVYTHCPKLNDRIGIHLSLYDFDAVRGALQPDRTGRVSMGDIKAVRRLLEASST